MISNSQTFLYKFACSQAKISEEDRFITGLQGTVTQNINEVYSYGTGKSDVATINMKTGDLFRIRWDYDPSKGTHVNAEFFGTTTTGTTKIAFFPSSNNRPGDPTAAELYQQVVRDQSTQLGYNTVANDPSQKTYTPLQRAGANLQRPAPQSTLDDMASRLAARWENSSC